MPIYEYKCGECGTVFEFMQKFSDAPLTTHQDCGGTLEKLISRSAFALKGSGWYVSDYARAGAKPEANGDSKKDSGSSDSSSDSILLPLSQGCQLLPRLPSGLYL